MKEEKMQGSNGSTEARTYVVCVNPYWVRGTQVFDADAPGADTGIDGGDDDPAGGRCDSLWHDAKAPLYVGAAMARSAAEACFKAYENNTNYPLRCLYAVPIRAGRG